MYLYNEILYRINTPELPDGYALRHGCQMAWPDVHVRIWILFTTIPVFAIAKYFLHQFVEKTFGKLQTVHANLPSGEVK